MEQLGIDFNATGSVMSKSELEELRRKRGECITCGRKCFQKKLFKMIPITDHGKVQAGRCLNCKPLDANENGLIPAVSRPATKEDLARFSRSQSNLGLTGPSVRPPPTESSSSGGSTSRRRQSQRSLSGSEASSRNVASSPASGRPPSRSNSGSHAVAAASLPPIGDASALAVGRGRRGGDLDSSSSRGETRGDRSVTPTNSQRHIDGSQRHIDGSQRHIDGSQRHIDSSQRHIDSSQRHIDNSSSNHHAAMADLDGSSQRGLPAANPRRRRSHTRIPSTDPTPAHGFDISDQNDGRDIYIEENDYNAGRKAVNDELQNSIAQMGMYDDDEMEVHPDDYYRSDLSQRSFGGAAHNDQPLRSVSRQYSGDGSHGREPRHGMLDRGGEILEYVDNQQRDAVGPPYTGSNRTLSSVGSVGDMNSHRFVEDAVETNTLRSLESGGSRSVVNGDEERAIDRLHAANGDCAEILDVMREYLSSALVQSYALKEISCLHLGPDDQDRLAHFGAMELITDAMHANLDDIELQIHGCRAIWNGSGTPENQLAFVDAGALDIILIDMDRFIDDAEVQECAMGTISNLAAAEANLSPLVEKGTVIRVVEAMNKHSDNKLVQAKGCSAITNMASHLSPLKRDIMEMGGGGAVVICMVMHPDDFDLQEKALRALKNLSSNSDENKIELANIGGIDAVITAMQVHRDQPGVQEAGAWTISNLASNNDNKAVIGDCGGIDVVIRAMWVHSDNVKVQEWCCRALYTLTLDRHNSGMVLQVGGISAIVNSMQAHVDSSPVQEMGCAVLCNLAFDESSKMRIVDEEALDAIVLAMVLYTDDAKVQESACEVLLQLAIVENFKSMQASNIGELARAAAAKFPENCKEPAYKLLHVLEGYCEQY